MEQIITKNYVEKYKTLNQERSVFSVHSGVSGFCHPGSKILSPRLKKRFSQPKMPTLFGRNSKMILVQIEQDTSSFGHALSIISL